MVAEDGAVTQRPTIAGSRPWRLCMGRTREEAVPPKPRGCGQLVGAGATLSKGTVMGTNTLASPFFPLSSLLPGPPVGCIQMGAGQRGSVGKAAHRASSLRFRGELEKAENGSEAQ